MGYEDPPWVFKGRALYQLHLVKVEQARRFIPDHLKIVSLFGYTLGGLYLARYSDSPAGAFDEVVALAGLVWNFPSSCAWAARVYVNNWEARNHGRAAIGLPSCHAAFDVPSKSSSVTRSWWSPSANGAPAPELCRVRLRNLERRRWWQRRPPVYAEGEGEVCSMALPAPGAGRHGLRLNLSLPSFSGGTPMVPEVLQYACRLSTRIRPVEAMHISAPPADAHEADTDALRCVLTGRPVVGLAFDDMVMSVQAPVRLYSRGFADVSSAAAACA